MTIEEHKEFSVESSSLKDVRSFAREVLAKDPIFQNSMDDVVLALAEAAQNIVSQSFLSWYDNHHGRYFRPFEPQERT